MRVLFAVACIALGGSVGCADVLGLDRYDAGQTSATTTGASGAAGGGGNQAGTTYVDLVLSHHPMAYWRLGDTTGTVARDEVGSYDGNYTPESTLSTPGLIFGDPDTAVRFHGESSPGILMTVDFNFAGVPSFTLETWVQNDDIGTTASLFTTETVDPSSMMTEGYDLVSEAGVLRFERVVNGVPTTVQGPAMMVGQATHVAARFDDDLEQLCLFINGGAPQCVTDQGVLQPTGQNLVVGKMLDGIMDEVAVYATALEDDAIAAHYQAGAVE